MRVNTAMKALLVSALIATACSSNGTDTVADGDASTATIEASDDTLGGEQVALGSGDEPETVTVEGDSQQSDSTVEKTETKDADASDDKKSTDEADDKHGDKDQDTGKKTDKDAGKDDQKTESGGSSTTAESSSEQAAESDAGTGSGNSGGSSNDDSNAGSNSDNSGSTASTAAPSSGGNNDSNNSGNGNDSASDTTAAPATTAPPATTAAPETTAAPSAAPAPAPAPAPGNLTLAFNENFDDGNWRSRLDTGLFHRDDHLVNQTQWVGDHVSTGPNDLCGPPTEKRTVLRGDRDANFNDDWIYRCVPGGDLNKAHLMTSIGSTSGYSLGGFAPKNTFTNVREVRWDVNQTDLGDRQWTEVAIIPAGRFNINRLPCTLDVPCDTVTHDVLGSAGTQWGGQRSRRIVTPEEPGGFTQAGGPLGYRCQGCPYAPSQGFGEAYGVGDPALTSLPIRRQNYFRDNGNGTLTWGFQLADGSFNEFTAPGSFPTGQVRVVFKDHNYTPHKAPATLLPVTTFTWHWDNLQVFTG